MTPFADIPEARRAMRRYLSVAEGVLPQPTFERLEDLADSPSPTEVIATSAELLYARRHQLDDAGRTITGQLAAFAAAWGLFGMATANRGGLIFQAMGRDLAAGEVATDAVDPAPAPQFVEQPEAAS